MTRALLALAAAVVVPAILLALLYLGAFILAQCVAAAMASA